MSKKRLTCWKETPPTAYFIPQSNFFSTQPSSLIKFLTFYFFLLPPITYITPSDRPSFRLSLSLWLSPPSLSRSLLITLSHYFSFSRITFFSFITSLFLIISLSFSLSLFVSLYLPLHSLPYLCQANEIERMDLVGTVDGCDAIIG